MAMHNQSYSVNMSNTVINLPENDFARLGIHPESPTSYVPISEELHFVSTQSYSNENTSSGSARNEPQISASEVSGQSMFQ